MMVKRRVAHVTTAHPALDNRIFHKECFALRDAGFDVHLIAVAQRDEVIDGICVHAVPRRRRRIERFTLGPVDAWLALRRLRPHLIQVHDPELIPLAILWRLVRRRPAIFDAHESLPNQIAGKRYVPHSVRPIVARLSRMVEWMADRWLDGVVVATPAIARTFFNERVTLVQNFPWLRSFPTPTAIHSSVRDAVYVGSISKQRGLNQMLAAGPDPDGQGSLVLAGPVADDAQERLTAAAAGQVDYRGIVSVSDVPNLLREARLGLALLHPLPNYLEAQATKIFEYMAAGRPFVASNFPAWTSQLGPHECGFFVDPLDTRAIGEAIARLRANPRLAQEMGDRGRVAVERHFTFDAEAARLVALTRHLTDGDR